MVPNEPSMTDVDAEAASRISRLEGRLHVLSGALRAFAEATTDYERLLNVVARAVADVVADGSLCAPSVGAGT